MRNGTGRAGATPPRQTKPPAKPARQPATQNYLSKQVSKRKPPTRFEFEVCVSFAGEVREVVQKVVGSLKRRRIKYFYDLDEQADLLGRDLFTYLDEVYRKKSRFCIMFISEHYPLKQWTIHERKSIQARMFESKDDYLIPVRLDDTEVPGVLATLGYIDGRSRTPSEIAALIQQKVRGKAAPKKPRKKAADATATRKVNWSYMTNLRKLKKALSDPVALALLNVTAARPGQMVPFDDVLRQAGITEARRGMTGLSVLTKTIKREFNLSADKVTWPVEKHHGADGSGQTSYRMAPEVAQAWLKCAG